MHVLSKTIRTLVAGAALCGMAGVAQAEIVVGVILSETGPGASLGVPYKNALDIQDTKVGDETVRFVMLNDNSDPTLTVKNIQRLIHDVNADVIIGPSNVPQTMAAMRFANDAGIAMLPLAPVALPDDQKKWTFVIPQSVEYMVAGVIDDMKANGVKSAGYMGYSDSWGDMVWGAFKNAADEAGIKVLGDERYARTDTSVKAQTLRLMSANPDAIMVGGSGTPGALPHIELTQSGYKGRQYDNHGAVNQDFLRVGAKNVENTVAPTGPLVVINQLPESHPLKAIGQEFIQKYEDKYGAGTANPFAGYANDAYLLIRNAAPAALAKAKPGTKEFRDALRDALEQTDKLDGTEATYTFSPDNHHGAQDNARVMVKVDNGAWKLMQD